MFRVDLRRQMSGGSCKIVRLVRRRSPAESSLVSAGSSTEAFKTGTTAVSDGNSVAPLTQVDCAAGTRLQ